MGTRVPDLYMQNAKLRTNLKWFCPHCRTSLSQKGTAHQCPHCSFTVHDKNGYFDAGAPSKIEFPKERRDMLANIETSHFWFGPRDALLKSILKRTAPSNKRMIELGCSTGRFLAGLAMPMDLTVGVDAFESSIQAAALRQKNTIFLRADACAVPLEDGIFDTVVSLDTLEHMPPKNFLDEARRLLRQGGWLFLSVPAAPCLWSDADEKAGHRCRYTLETLSTELQAHGWKINGHTHYQFFLYPLMVISRIFLKGKNPIEKHPPVFINKFLGFINTLETWALSGCCLPFGSSIIVWAQKHE